MYGQIYIIKIKNPDSKFNGHFYIGQHKGDVVSDNYWGSGRKIRSYQKRWGSSGLIREVLATANSLEELNSLEAQYVNQEILNDPLCMNLITGGRKGHGDSQETIKLKSLAGKKGAIIAKEKCGGCLPCHNKTVRKKAAETYRKKCAQMSPEEKQIFRNHYKGYNNPEYGLLISLVRRLNFDIKMRTDKRLKELTSDFEEYKKIGSPENVAKLEEKFATLLEVIGEKNN